MTPLAASFMSSRKISKEFEYFLKEEKVKHKVLRTIEEMVEDEELGLALKLKFTEEKIRRHQSEVERTTPFINYRLLPSPSPSELQNLSSELVQNLGLPISPEDLLLIAHSSLEKIWKKQRFKKKLDEKKLPRNKPEVELNSEARIKFLRDLYQDLPEWLLLLWEVDPHFISAFRGHLARCMGYYQRTDNVEMFNRLQKYINELTENVRRIFGLDISHPANHCPSEVYWNIKAKLEEDPKVRVITGSINCPFNW